MISCTDMELLLSDYADGVSDARTRRIVEQHVQLCSRCRRRLEQAQQIAQQLRRLPLMPAGLSSRVARQRRLIEEEAARDRRGLEHYPFYVSALLAAAIVTLALLLIFYFGV